MFRRWLAGFRQTPCIWWNSYFARIEDKEGHALDCIRRVIAIERHIFKTFPYYLGSGQDQITTYNVLHSRRIKYFLLLITRPHAKKDAKHVPGLVEHVDRPCIKTFDFWGLTLVLRFLVFIGHAVKEQDGIPCYMWGHWHKARLELQHHWNQLIHSCCICAEAMCLAQPVPDVPMIASLHEHGVGCQGMVSLGDISKLRASVTACIWQVYVHDIDRCLWFGRIAIRFLHVLVIDLVQNHHCQHGSKLGVNVLDPIDAVTVRSDDKVDMRLGWWCSSDLEIPHPWAARSCILRRGQSRRDVDDLLTSWKELRQTISQRETT
mmetsp:Transcript_78002/g.135181  ORF Transcript_78002/g.135181 Transcript_78002/m.135181 type:complete len:320 (+) Transcript_78002:439-1398(+)